jgi:general secretion pathway protein M
MTAFEPRSVTRSPTISAALYAVLLLSLGLTIVTAMAHIYDSYTAYAESLARLEHLEARPHANNDERAPSGSPILEGQTATVANAALLQRVTSAITTAGGTVISSEIDQNGTQSKDGYLKVISTLEIRHGALQRLLHDLEAGMPFLFIEQLLVQTISNPPDSDLLRVRLAVSGLWRGGR